MNKRSKTKNGDERHTLWGTFLKCIEIAGVQYPDLDVAASDSFHWANAYYTKRENGLIKPWFVPHLGSKTVVWCNPPWSNIGPWVNKAWNSMLRGECSKVIMLIPDNRHGTQWRQKLVEWTRDGRENAMSQVSLTTHYLPGRPKYGTPEDPAGKNQKTPPFGSMVLLWKRNN